MFAPFTSQDIFLRITLTSRKMPYKRESQQHLPAGLPGEEFKRFVHRYEVEQETAKYAAYQRPEATSSSLSAPRRRDADIISSTRRGLGIGYDTSEHVVTGKNPVPQRYIDEANRWLAQVTDEEASQPIPQRCIDDYNRLWHEDDEDNDADQYMADVMPKAPWRNHVVPEAAVYGVLPYLPRQGHMKPPPGDSPCSSDDFRFCQPRRSDPDTPVSSAFGQLSDDLVERPRRRLQKKRKSANLAGRVFGA
ncbi:hypothetical protein CC80DRAFT_553715 [Byssothecium circinans]|uniref:Uncharacterized protein n=1 Tax=Byssothecium circinans TaxID=147558 RepID=A0A6A5TFT5_9PLEO|nr:hypothetical protein CC80DRAFT_553715 [Byssothecium circinans]